jgi:hypothetical protein
MVWFSWGALSDQKGVCFFYMLLVLSSVVFLGSESFQTPWPYFTLSDLRLPLSSPPTTHRVTVEVFEPAEHCPLLITSRHGPHRKTQLYHCCSQTVALLRIYCLATGTCLLSHCPETTQIYPSSSQSLHGNDSSVYSILFKIATARHFGFSRILKIRIYGTVLCPRNPFGLKNVLNIKVKLRFLAVFTGARHWSLFRTSWIQSTSTILFH